MVLQEGPAGGAPPGGAHSLEGLRAPRLCWRGLFLVYLPRRGTIPKFTLQAWRVFLIVLRHRVSLWHPAFALACSLFGGLGLVAAV